MQAKVNKFQQGCIYHNLDKKEDFVHGYAQLLDQKMQDFPPVRQKEKNSLEIQSTLSQFYQELASFHIKGSVKLLKTS